VTLHRHRHAIVTCVYRQHFCNAQEPCFALFLQTLHNRDENLGHLVVMMRQHTVDLEDIDIVGLQPLKALLKRPDRNLGVGEEIAVHAASPLGGNQVRVSRVTAQRTAQHRLGFAIGFGRIEQVHTQFKSTGDERCATCIVEACFLAELRRAAGSVAEKRNVHTGIAKFSVLHFETNAAG